MISPEQRKRLQEFTPEELKRVALLALKKIKEKRAASNELSHMQAQLRAVREKYRSLGHEVWWASFREMHEEEQAILNGWTREQKMSLLQFMLKPGTGITLELTDEWLHTLLLHNPGVLAEAQRLKERMPVIPWHAQRAKEEGETYWLRLAGSYQGD